MSTFRLYAGLQMLSERNSACKNLFIGACSCWDSRPSLVEMDRKFNIVGTLGYVDSYSKFLYRHSKVLRLYALAHIAAGAVS